MAHLKYTLIPPECMWPNDGSFEQNEAGGVVKGTLCGTNAYYRIEGDAPFYLCEEHRQKAAESDFAIVPLTGRELLVSARDEQ